MKPPKYKPKVKLVGEDGNAFSILGRVSGALKIAGADEEYVKDYQNRAMDGAYDDLLVITMEEIEVA